MMKIIMHCQLCKINNFEIIIHHYSSFSLMVINLEATTAAMIETSVKQAAKM